jgi:hypothetical protein
MGEGCSAVPIKVPKRGNRNARLPSSPITRLPSSPITQDGNGRHGCESKNERPLEGCVRAWSVCSIRSGYFSSCGPLQRFSDFPLSATVTPNFFPLYHFFILFSPYFFISRSGSP